MKKMKSFSHSRGVLIVEYDEAPAAGDPTLVLTIKVDDGKSDEVYRSWAPLTPQTHTDVSWFLKQHSPEGSHWDTEFQKLWKKSIWPEIQPKPTYKPKRKW